VNYAKGALDFVWLHIHERGEQIGHGARRSDALDAGPGPDCARQTPLCDPNFGVGRAAESRAGKNFVAH